MSYTCLQKLDFRPVETKHYAEILPYFKGKGLLAAEYSALYIFMWGAYLGIEYATLDDVLFLRRNNRFGISYYPPLAMGKPLTAALPALAAVAEGESVRVCAIPEGEVENVEKALTVLEKGTSRRWADYIYAAEDLATLRGHRYNKKRNLVHQFEKLYPDHVYEPLDEGNLAEVIAFMQDFMTQGERTEDEQNENRLAAAVLANWHKLPVVGGVLRVEGRVAAFTVGEEIDDMLLVHIEKADRQYKGAYQAINQRFAAERCEKSAIHYINREDDTGDEGLRHAKLSYYPVQILHKYHMVVKNDF